MKTVVSTVDSVLNPDKVNVTVKMRETYCVGADAVAKIGELVNSYATQLEEDIKITGKEGSAGPDPLVLRKAYLAGEDNMRRFQGSDLARVEDRVAKLEDIVAGLRDQDVEVFSQRIGGVDVRLLDARLADAVVAIFGEGGLLKRVEQLESQGGVAEQLEDLRNNDRLATAEMSHLRQRVKALEAEKEERDG